MTEWSARQFKLLKKLSATAFSQRLPVRPMRRKTEVHQAGTMNEMNHWVVVYDDADRDVLEDTDRPLRHWARRHGSPLLDDELTWVPAGAVKAVSDFEQCDLVLFRAKSPFPGGIWTSSISPALQRGLDRLTRKEACLAVEYTAAMPANSNALGRIGRLFDHVRAGIPTLYAVPKAGYEGVDEGRGQKTSSIRGLHDEVQQRRIKANRVLPIDKLDKKAFHFRELGRWVPLYTLSLADSYSVPCGVVPLPDAVKTCPPMWRHSGAELAPLYELISGVISQGQRLGTTSPAYKQVRAQTEALVANGTRARPKPPPEWLADVAKHGHPNGSRRYADGQAHMPFSLTKTRVWPIEKQPAKTLAAFLASYHGPRSKLGASAANKLPSHWKSARLLIEMDPPPLEHWREKTYICRLLALEQCFLRRSVNEKQRPWAMAPDPRDRQHLVAVRLTVTSEEVWQEAQTDVYVRRWIDFADVLLLQDGLFLGRLWTAPSDGPVKLS
jgi:hypothetical protein